MYKFSALSKAILIIYGAVGHRTSPGYRFKSIFKSGPNSSRTANERALSEQLTEISCPLLQLLLAVLFIGACGISSVFLPNVCISASFKNSVKLVL